MKKVCFLLVLCLFASLFFASCSSNKLCPAYRSVTYMEQPENIDQWQLAQVNR